MKIARPRWAAGVLLAPQQFQQQARWEALCNDNIAHMVHRHPWGVLLAEFDPDALRSGALKATRLRLRLACGTLIDTERVDPLPAAMPLPAVTVDGEQALTVVLALPRLQANGGNCPSSEHTSPHAARYQQVLRDVPDLLGEESAQISVLEHCIALHAEHQVPPDQVHCPVARLVADGQGRWALDPTFIAPLLTISAHPPLCRRLDNLLTQLDAKRQRLMGLRRESQARMADFAVADVSLFWLLNVLNEQQPLLAHLCQQPTWHPEPVYRVLARLAGSLLTFSLDHDQDAIPAYRHDQLAAVFDGLFSLIGRLLEASLPSRVISLPLQRQGEHRWRVSLDDPRLRDPEGVDLYLSVQASVPPARLREQLPGLCKAGPPDVVERLVDAALDGIPLVPMAQVPAAIALRLDNQIFALDLTHPTARAMLAEGACAFHVPSTLPDLRLELYAVLRS